ncbi:hypothetical protein K493DRAFT_298564 [Basidiobolus meristosporus CBS 931.73]|uniref:Uncharacterized protein n=1 Tax=Basidiobolus meristosporus CBS 931.73 TaxID=1314790 RepID=A0A1Y1YSV8_9FUNG|nr:hypothetical protein K493DRAFT_298564 [Basidiobolus meristosporus CBS 931.73]|eukprot:ORY01101.1 hypothetical protein K493DRAFT_298564 [Basidiobolus meristosporus CBS 931.73]
MSNSIPFAHSISRSFRKIFSKRGARHNTNIQQENSGRDDVCSDSGVSLTNSEGSTWERVFLRTSSQAFPSAEKTSLNDGSGLGSLRNSKRLSDSPQADPKPKETQLHSGIYGELCTGFGGSIPMEKSPLPKQGHCEKCTTHSKTPRKRCYCEFEPAHNGYPDNRKRKKSIFNAGSLLKRKKTFGESQCQPIKKVRKGSGSSGFMGPLFGRRLFGGRGGSRSGEECAPAHEDPAEDPSSPETIAKFENRLQKVESFERMIVDPELRNETIRLALTPNILS